MTDQDDIERKVRAIEAMPLTQRDVLMDVCGELVDLSTEALEFFEIVVSETKAIRSFDPVVVMANAVARWRAVRKRN